jgi:predicted lipoprotein with Yx(FWY)xxD motif
MRYLRIVLPLIGGVLVLVGCGGGGHQSGAGRPATNQDVTLSVRSVGTLGPIIETHGWTLYMYPPDRQRKVTCTKVEECQSAWPPLFVTAGHRVVAGPGVKPGLIGTMAGDGGRVVTYNHWPLYYYIGDRKAEELHGQGQGFNWYVIAPDGVPNKSVSPSPID